METKLSRRRRWARGASALVVATAAAGCVGAIGGDSPGGNVLTEPPKPKAAFEPEPATIHRLTSVQVQNTWRALFGEKLTVPQASELPSDDQAYGFRSIAAAMKTISPLEVEEYEHATYAVLDQVWKEDAWRDSIVGCSPETSEDPCVRAYFERFGRLAWRRRLDTEEVDGLVAVTKEVGAYTNTTAEALKFGTAALLQSPHFLFRIEVGEPVGAEDLEHQGLLRLTGTELASRVSYLLLDAPPNTDLLDAAESGLLDDPSLVAAGVEYLLASPEARPPATS